jgi:DNA-binding response OmpR family regulator
MRILVVDDEPAIRHLIDRLLTRRGHHVLVAPSAGEANAMVLDSWLPIDAAVLDIGLPGMNGLAFGELLVGLFPGIRLIFISGWAEWPGHENRPAGSALLSKPFNMANLLTELGINDSMGSAAGPSTSPDSATPFVVHDTRPLRNRSGYRN